MREQLCLALRSRWYLTEEEIRSILADREFFQLYLQNALARRAVTGGVPEDPIDATDGQAIFFLAEFDDTGILPDLLKCLRMNDRDLRLLYSDSLTEFMWIPFARIGHARLPELWEFVTDPDVDLFARHAVVAGVVALHHFHPERRSDSVAFIERLLNRRDCFPVDHLAGILCDCADSGLMELMNRAEQFAATLDEEKEENFPTVTVEDVRNAFRDGPREDFISLRAHDVYGVNRQWQRWTERQEEDHKAVFPDWALQQSALLEKVNTAMVAQVEDRDSAGPAREHFALAMSLADLVTTEDRMEELEAAMDGDVLSWLLEMPFALARFGMVREATELGRRWASITSRDNFLADRAVILAEAGLIEEARRQIEEALREFPDDVWVRIKMGDAYRALHEMNIAESCYRHALAISEKEYDRAGVLERLVPMLQKLGRGDEAEALEAEEEARRRDEGHREQPQRRESPKVGRNDPCPCGSKKPDGSPVKYKHCHGK